MTIQDTIRQALGADPVVAGLVADRIYTGQIPDHDQPGPFVYYIVTERETSDELEATDAEVFTVEVDAVSKDYQTSCDLAAAVRSVLYTLAAGQVDSCLYRSGRADTGENGEYRETRVYGVRGLNATIVPDAAGRALVTVADGDLLIGDQAVMRAAPSLLTADLTGQTAAAELVAALVEQGIIVTSGDIVAAAIPRVEVREDGLYFGGVLLVSDTPPTVNYSRSAAGETAAVAAIRAALAEQKLILDLTTA